MSLVRHCSARSLTLALLLVVLLPARMLAQPVDSNNKPLAEIKSLYTKYEYRIPMRDGKRLFTSVYAPKDATQSFPILLTRTPYSVRPYGVDQYRDNLGPSALSMKAGYIFVYAGSCRGR